MHNTTVNIAIVVSEFNHEITEKLLTGALLRLSQLGVDPQNIRVIKVPGAVEIPLTAKMLGLSKKYQAIICLGAVIRGDTDHYDYVCQQVSDGCQRVMLELNMPIIFGILTTANDEQAEARVSDPSNHKGMEAADAAMKMIQVMETISIGLQNVNNAVDTSVSRKA